MKKVFIVQHLHVMPDGEEDKKLIGAFSSAFRAQEAVDRLSSTPGFRDHPRAIDPIGEDSMDGFYIDEYTVNKDYWTEGDTTD